MAASHQFMIVMSPAGWLPRDWDQLRPQCLYWILTTFIFYSDMPYLLVKIAVHIHLHVTDINYMWCSTEAVFNICVFQPILKSEQYGDGFYYVVSYKRRDVRNAPEHKVNVTGWQHREVIIKDQEMFKEYEIYVQSANSKGLARSATVERRLGFSGQDGTSPLFLFLNSFMHSLKSSYSQFASICFWYLSKDVTSNYVAHCFVAHFVNVH